MPKTIPQLTDATTVNAADELIIQQSGITKRATAAELFNNAPTTASGSTSARSLAARFADQVNVKDFGAVADCTNQGVGTDVVPAILAAVNHAVANIGDGAVVTLPAGRYRCSTSCVLNLQGKKNITLDFQGLLTSDNAAMTVFTIENGEGLILNADLHEGGVFNGWLAPQPYGPCDYYNTRDAAAAGGQEMFLMRGLLNYAVHLRAHGYAGRVLRTDERSNAAHRHTQAIKGWIYTRRNYDFSKARTAQALWADGGTAAPNLGNWGRLDAIVSDFDWVGPVWRRLNDIDIASLDTAYANAGPSFRGCIVITGNTWFIGDTDQGSGSRHLELVPSTVNCAFFNVKFMRFLNKGSGLFADSVVHLKTQIHYVASSSAYSKAVELTNCVESVVDVSAFGTGETLLDINGSSSANIICTVDNLSSTNTDDSVVVASSVSNTISINPRLASSASGKSALKIGGTGVVFVNNPLLSGSASSNIFDITSTSNQVFVSGGSVSGSATAFKGGVAPRSVFNTTGLSSAANYVFRTNQGGASAGQGGEVQFGINDSSFVQHAPMASIKGSLVNGVGTELQGDLLLQVRPFGTAGQSLQNGLSVSYTTTDGETYAKLLTRISGSNVERRVKVGGTGTGPSGVGRALFVDN